MNAISVFKTMENSDAFFTDLCSYFVTMQVSERGGLYSFFAVLLNDCVFDFLRQLREIPCI